MHRLIVILEKVIQGLCWIRALRRYQKKQYSLALEQLNKITYRNNKMKYQIWLLEACIKFDLRDYQGAIKCASMCLSVDRHAHNEYDALYIELYAKKLKTHCEYLIEPIKNNEYLRRKFKHPKRDSVSRHLIDKFPGFDDGEP